MPNEFTKKQFAIYIGIDIHILNLTLSTEVHTLRAGHKIREKLPFGAESKILTLRLLSRAACPVQGHDFHLFNRPDVRWSPS